MPKNACFNLPINTFHSRYIPGFQVLKRSLKSLALIQIKALKGLKSEQKVLNSQSQARPCNVACHQKNEYVYAQNKNRYLSMGYTASL